jgi:folate-binding protein YgfZ
MTLRDLQISSGAVFEDGLSVPRHYGDPDQAYAAAKNGAVLVDRSDEGRIEITDADRLAIVNRMSTNKVDDLQPGEARATVLTTPVGRIIDRVVLHNLDDVHTLVRTSSGRGGAIADYLRRNIFFRDKMQVNDRSGELAQLALYGPQAGAVVQAIWPDVDAVDLHQMRDVPFEDAVVRVIGLDASGVPAVGLIVPAVQAAALWTALLNAGQTHDLRPAGWTTTEQLRIEAGLPGPVGELNEDYIPLEAGLWADVSFTKGCYTGQEIIARMESRGKLAKTLVALQLSGPAVVGAALMVDGRSQGTLTSITALPDGSWHGVGFVKLALSNIGQSLALDGGVTAVIKTP